MKTSLSRGPTHPFLKGVGRRAHGLRVPLVEVIEEEAKGLQREVRHVGEGRRELRRREEPVPIGSRAARSVAAAQGGLRRHGPQGIPPHSSLRRQPFCGT